MNNSFNKHANFGGKHKKHLVIATSTKLSIFEVAPFVFGTVQQQIQFLQQKMLLATNMTCCNCNTQMIIIGNRSDISDGWRIQV